MTAPTTKRQPVPFGKYLLLDRINIGGMAEVWRGKMFGAGGFERLVAIKRILPNIAEDEEFIKMFIDEAKIAVQLTHANIAQIYELGHINNSYFIAMEYIPGKDARAIFERCRKKGEPAPVPLSCFVIAKLCEGLDYAHRKKDGMGRDMNIVHRDVSPQNVLVSFEGEVKVIDFGIAKAAGQATKTQAGILKGKFGYMSPEQIRGLPLDRRSDVFAIGICLYEMLTGERLFIGESDFSVLEKVRKADVTPPSTYNRRIPPALEKIVLKALARDVDTRYQYANELADDLQRFLITSDTIFSRKDLVQYMKSTFAEEVDREKMRLQEYSQIKIPEGMAAAVEAASLGTTPARPSSPGVGKAMTAQLKTVPSMPPRTAPGGIPKLTAAAPVSMTEADTNESTQVVDEATAEARIRKPSGAPEMDAEPATMLAGQSVAPSIKPLVPPGQSSANGHGSWAPPNMAPARVAGDSSFSEMATGPVDAIFTGWLSVLNRPLMTIRSERGRLLALLGATAALLVVLLVMTVVALWPTPVGFVLLDVTPAEVKAARVQINGVDLGLLSGWPVLQKVKAGPAVVVVSAEGFHTFAQPIEVQQGSQPTAVNASLKRDIKMAQLTVITEPKDAEVVLNGDIKRKEGDATGSLLALEIPYGAQSTLVVRKTGLRAVTEQITPGNEEETLRRNVTLQVADLILALASDPPKAEVVVNGKGTHMFTPVTFKVPTDAQKIELMRRCYSPESIPLEAPADPAKPIFRKLTKLPSCR